MKNGFFAFSHEMEPKSGLLVARKSDVEAPGHHPFATWVVVSADDFNVTISRAKLIMLRTTKKAATFTETKTITKNSFVRNFALHMQSNGLAATSVL